jgi:hypothetical protein
MKKGMMMPPFINKIEITPPTLEFWQELQEIMQGLGFTNAHSKFIQQQMYSFTAEPFYMDEGYTGLFAWYSTKEGIDNRLLQLAFALTIPKDMKP